MKKNSNSSDTFGSYIRKLRIKNDIGQRELAKQIGVAPSYLNDMEKNKRTAPRTELIKKLSVKLKADLNLLFDLAGNSKKTVAPDIVDYIEKNLKEIETDMNQSMKNVYKLPSAKKSKDRKKRNALSVSATRTVNKHNVKIVVSFD